MASERYEVEILSPEGEVKIETNDLDDAAARFYKEVAENYSEPSVSVYLHDLVSSKTLASWDYSMEDEFGRVIYGR